MSVAEIDPAEMARFVFERVMWDFETHRALGHRGRKVRVSGCTACVLEIPAPPVDRRPEGERLAAGAGALS